MSLPPHVTNILVNLQIYAWGKERGFPDKEAREEFMKNCHTHVFSSLQHVRDDWPWILRIKYRAPGVLRVESRAAHHVPYDDELKMAHDEVPSDMWRMVKPMTVRRFWIAVQERGWLDSASPNMGDDDLVELNDWCAIRDVINAHGAPAAEAV